MNQSHFSRQSSGLSPSRLNPPDPIDQITAKLSQLHALLTCLHADGLENFNTLCPEIQDNLLCLTAELTLSISDTVALLPYPTYATRS